MLALGWAALVWAQTAVRHADVEKEIRQARFDRVLILTDAALKEQPKDPQMRFWHALAHERLGRLTEAENEYRSLTQDHPELPEPHNNLGVLALRRGDIDGAQMAFEQALRMNSAYAEALENLGDVLRLQARRMYEKAERLEPTRPGLHDKMRNLPNLPSSLSTKP